MKSIDYMNVALDEASKAFEKGEVPVGAVIVSENGDILSMAHNLCEAKNDPTAHAEILAIQKATKKIQSPRLLNCDIYITLEPCSMCATAISFARMRRVYFGSYDPKSGGVEHGAKIFKQKTCHHKPEIYGGIKESDCSDILKRFFQGLRYS